MEDRSMDRYDASEANSAVASIAAHSAISITSSI